MTKEQYLAQRKDLLAQAQTMLNEGKTDEANAKMAEVTALDAKWDEIAKAQANMAALNAQPVVAEVTKEIMGAGTVIDKVAPAKTKDEKAAYVNAWAKSMMGQPLTDDEKAVFDKINDGFRNTTQTAATHAILIPETVAADIWKEAADLFPILGDVRMTRVPGDLTIIKESATGDDADWYDEATAVAEDDVAFGELKLTGCELAKDITVSWKLKKMAMDAFIPYITTKLAEKMGAALAKAIVSGKGKPGAEDNWKAQPKGIVTALEAEANTPQVVTYDDDTDPLAYGKITSAMGKVKSAYKTGAAIYAKSATIWDKLANLLDLNGRPLFIPDVTGGGVGRMFGLPVKEEDSVGDGEILIGNVSRGYVANINEDMTIYTEDHKKTRTTDYISYAIVDGDVLTTKAFAVIKPAADPQT